MPGRRLILAMFLTGAVFAGLGCSSTRPGALSAVQPTSDSPRAGNAYLLRGFIGIFSTGIDDLTAKINTSGVRAHVYQDDQWSSLAATIREKYRGETEHEPIVLIGHSYGADDVVRIARQLQEDKIDVDLLITLDPVTPPKVPGNVKTCINLYQSNGVADALPWLRGIPLTADEPGPARLVNANIRKDRTDLLEPGVDHFNIEKKTKIHGEVLKQVLAACPPRQQWVMARTLSRLAAGQVAPPSPIVAPAPSKPVTVTQTDTGVLGGN